MRIGAGDGAGRSVSGMEEHLRVSAMLDISPEVGYISGRVSERTAGCAEMFADMTSTGE